MIEPDPLEILIAGNAGQGAVLAGIFLAEAVTLAGRITTQTSKTGAAVRSGISEAHVLISYNRVDYPYVEIPHVLIALSQNAADQHAASLHFSGTAVFDPDAVSFPEGFECRRIPICAGRASRECRVATGCDNLILLSAFTEASAIVSAQHLLGVLGDRSKRYPPDAEAALLLGMRLAREYKGF